MQGGPGINKYLIREFKNKNIVSNSVRMHRLASLISKLSQQFQLYKHRFKLHQTTLLSVLVFIFFSAVPNFKKSSFQIGLECVSKHLKFAFKFSQQFQLPKYRFKQSPNAPLSVLDLKMFSPVPTTESSFQITPNCTISRPCFHFFSAVPT